MIDPRSTEEGGSLINTLNKNLLSKQLELKHCELDRKIKLPIQTHLNVDQSIITQLNENRMLGKKV